MDYQKRISWLAISISVYASLWGCSLAPSATDAADSNLRGKLTINGSSTLKPLVGQIAERFKIQNPQVKIKIKTKSSSEGLADTAEEKVDIAMVSRALLPSEKKEFQDFTIAREGVGIIVHEDNPIDSLSYEDILNIYTGRIDNWQEFGGTNNTIRVINKTQKNSTQELFLDYFQLDNAQIEANAVSQSNQQKIEIIASNPDAIGYVSIGIAEYHIAHGVPIKLLSIDGIKPTMAAVQDGSFPISRPLNLVTNTEPSGLTKEFIEFARSEKVHDLIKAENFAPIK
ncbi:MAG: phosphate ABC transporter substrate-binding protein [Xenococcaceae cyanobacterium MO_188.B32]|nr:phosphate ABC transporter substrate-binding protein [Xenococcaceae cyanobacterium MO_188.B32]